MRRHRLVGLVIAAASAFGPAALAEDLALTLRDLKEVPGGDGKVERRTLEERWDPAKTAIIVCDVWDLHHCRNAVRRLEEFAPRLNGVLKDARKRGIAIIHAPSDCMPAYEDHPARKRAVETPKAAKLPRDIESWCSRIPAEEKADYPIDQSDGGEDDDPQEHAEWAAKLEKLGRNPAMPWKRQLDTIEIDPGRDYISDRGDEVWSILEARGIENVILAGVHTNMCVLGRPFGLRQMVRNGKHAVLMRDMTDCMYNPKRRPFVDHFTGNDLIIAHVERYVCPTITSDQFLGGVPFRSRSDTRDEIDVISVPAPKKASRAAFESDWAVASIPSSWGEVTGGALDHYEGTAWYRSAVRLPRSWVDGGPLTLTFEPAGREIRAWLNGHALAADASPERTAFRIEPAWIEPDTANLLVFRAEHRGGAGGTGPAPVLASGTAESLGLRGRWQFRLGDNPSWSNMPLPARFGASTDIVFEP